MVRGITGYVLAGGRSSRMGQNKAELEIGGQSLLSLAVGKLQPVCDEVVVIGASETAGAARVIADLHPGCGPISGIEAALRDVRGDLAMFLPVDMPLLPSGLVCALGERWSRDAQAGARVAMVVSDGIAQPLVSLLHRDLLRFVTDAVARHRFRVRPLLEQATADLAADAGTDPALVLCRTVVETGTAERPSAVLLGKGTVWQPTSAEWKFRHLWFSNLNTPGEFLEAQGFAADLWSGHRPE